MLYLRSFNRFILFSLTLFIFSHAHSSSVVFIDRTIFESGLGTSITDTYEHGYQDSTYTDELMSAVIKETIYDAYSDYDSNHVIDLDGDADREYSSGHRFHSFELDFTETSFTEELDGNTLGVYGVGFDIEWSTGKSPTTAHVTYGNNTTEDFLLPLMSTSQPTTFWGITSSDYIQTIYFGLPEGQPKKYTIAIDNLTIGEVSTVPIPAALWLFGTAMIGLVGFGRRRISAQ